MAESVDNPGLEQLRLIRGELQSLHSGQREIRSDLLDMKVRLTAVEEGLAGVHRRMDRLDGRLERVEQRLELADA